MINCFKFHHIIHDTTASMHQQVPCTRKNDILLLIYLLRCCLRWNLWIWGDWTSVWHFEGGFFFEGNLKEIL